MSQEVQSSNVGKFLRSVTGKKKEVNKMSVEGSNEVEAGVNEEVTEPKVGKVDAYFTSADLKLLDGDITPLPAPKPNDNRGQLSARISEFMDKYNVSVAPFDAMGIPNDLEKLKDYTIVDMWNRKFAVNDKAARNKDAIIQHAKDLARRYEEGEVVDESIVAHLRVDTVSYDTLKYSYYELCMFNTLLKNYPFAVLDSNNTGDLRLTIGVVND